MIIFTQISVRYTFPVELFSFRVFHNVSINTSKACCKNLFCGVNVHYLTIAASPLLITYYIYVLTNMVADNINLFSCSPNEFSRVAYRIVSDNFEKRWLIQLIYFSFNYFFCTVLILSCCMYSLLLFFFVVY